MDKKRDYKNFADNCYDNSLNFTEEMQKEIKKNMEDCNLDNKNIDIYVDNIMNLIYETRYEW